MRKAKTAKCPLCGFTIKSNSNLKQNGEGTVNSMLRMRILPFAMLCFISILGAEFTSAQVTVITKQPQNQTAVVGQTATFTITISDPTCSVMWQRNGSNIVSGLDLVNHTTPPVALADNGAKFGVVVYNCKKAANAPSASRGFRCP